MILSPREGRNPSFSGGFRVGRGDSALGGDREETRDLWDELSQGGLEGG